MKRILLLLLVCAVKMAGAQVATHVVISEIYGGGGNSGATYRNDFIELYNPTSTAISLSGWSVQYASTAGGTTASPWQVTALSGTIPAKGFYLIREAAGAGTTLLALPRPDDSAGITMSATSGKVALVASTTALSGTCPASTTSVPIVDFVGYGSTASTTNFCFEGTGPAPATTNSSSVERKATSASTATTLGPGGAQELAGNSYETDDNSSDFVNQPDETPQNSSVTEGTVGNTVSVTAGTTPAEPATDGTFTITLSTAAPTGGITITYSLGGTAVSGTDYTDLSSGTLTIPAGSTTGTLTMDMIDDLTAEGPETIVITLLTATGSYTLSGTSAMLTITDNEITITPIHTIQGSGSAATAGTYTIEGIVTAVYPSLSPAGFYVQEETADADADPATSEGIFVVSSAAVAVGNQVTVTGTVQENAATPSFGQAVFTSPATVSVVNSSSPLPAVTDIMLPLAAASDFERYEGMLVRFPDTLTVTNNFTLGRFGELGLSKGPVYQPTQIIDLNDAVPSGTTARGTSNLAAINAQISSDSARTILLDDGQNTLTTLPYVNSDNTVRIGTTIDSLTGILGYAFSAYRIQPVPAIPLVFDYNARPAVPSVGASNVRVASFNVLNYFNGNGSGGGFPTARGAHSLVEFYRQRAKIIAAITELNADVVGLIEIENDGVGAASAIQDLVNGLDSVMGAGTYSIINDGATIQNFGTDAIRCGIIYKPAAVTAIGSAMLSANSVFNRPPLAQTFATVSTGIKFNFIINHFKSKSCSGSSGADTDQDDGQSCYTATRKLQAGGLVSFINTTVIPTSGTNRVLSVGDYNAYYEEDPLDSLRAAGYTVLSSATSYSYQFNGQIGSLDHAVVSGALSPFVTGIAKWNINAAEPVYLDYNDGVNDGGGDVVNAFAATYSRSPYRSSDHDPVLIGLNLPVTLPVKLISFNAVKTGAAAKISWVTAQEVSNSGFIVERSADGQTWQGIATVPAIGRKDGRTAYGATDETPLAGRNFYRLRCEDLDGSADYSEVRTLDFTGASGWRVFPNPAEGTLTVAVDYGSAAISQVQVLNTMNGTVLQLDRAAAGQVQLDVSSLQQGVYFLRVLLTDGTTDVKRFVKQ